MDAKLIKAFNEQIKNELYSAYMYLGMAAYFETISLPGFAKWMEKQTKEEFAHAMKLYGYLNNVGAGVELQAIPKPPASYDSALDVFKKTLAHEKQVTAMINNLYNMSQKTGDNAAVIFLQYFVSEQIEEEKSVTDVIAMLNRIKPDSGQMIMLDAQMGKRG